MKNYIVRNKVTNEVFGTFDTKEKASYILVNHVAEMNKYTRLDEDGFLSIFDFEMVEETEINSYEEAREYLGLNRDSLERDFVDTHDKKSCSALEELLTIADAWNKQDGFKPDLSDKDQCKYSPWFEYRENAKRFVCHDANLLFRGPDIGSLLCFATRERALDFGKKFEDLFNDLFG